MAALLPLCCARGLVYQSRIFPCCTFAHDRFVQSFCSPAYYVRCLAICPACFSGISLRIDYTLVKVRVLGEYIGRLTLEVKGRPVYIASKVTGPLANSVPQGLNSTCVGVSYNEKTATVKKVAKDTGATQDNKLKTQTKNS